MNASLQTFRKMVFKLLITGLVSLFAGNLSVNAQALTGIKTIPGSYSTIAAAVADLNANGVGTGGVTFSISPSYSELLTAPISVTATGTAANPIVFQKNGAGTNPLITAYVGTNTPGSAVQDGMWNLIGSDYVTIDGIDLTDPNTTNPATMEYGFALYKASLSNGAQNNIIKNCVITLSNVNNVAGSGPAVDGSRGIDVVNATATGAITALVPTARVGTNSYNGFFSNTIKNCNVGISLIGYAASTPFAAADTLNDIGGSSLTTGNTILNFGGATAATNPAAGIRTLAQYGINVSYNTINNNDGAGANHASTLRGIYLNTATSANGNCNNNTVTIKGGGTTQTIYAIDVEFGATAASNIVNVNNNTVENCSYTTATTGVFYGIYTSTTPATLNINNNIVRNNTVNGSTGTMYGISWTSPTNLSISNNQIYGLSRTAAGTTYGIYSASSSVNEVINNNTIYDFTNTATSSTNLTLIGIYQNTVAGIKEVKNNTIYNFSAIGSTATGNTIAGLNILRGTPLDISGNVIYGFSGTGSAVTGINLPTAIAGTYNAYKNKIYDLSSTIASPVISGILAGGSSASTTFNIYNNLIADLRASTASSADAIRGINITSTSSTSSVNVYYNTVYLNATSSGTNFGTAGIYHTVSATATTATLNLRNNIIVNNSTPAGTGFTAAFRRSGVALDNYAATSNNNLFYAGTPAAASVIFNDGTNRDQTLGAFRIRMATRDQASVTENPSWVSTTGANTGFLNLNTGIPTQTESKGVNIATFLTDYAGNIRQGNPGYPSQANGGGTAPDLGAWEFDGMPASAPSISGLSTTPGVQCVATSHTISATITNISGSLTSVVANYSINGVAQTALTMINTTGNTWATSIPAASPSNATIAWSVTATNSFSLSTLSSVSTYADEPLLGALTSVVASANPSCSGAPVQLSAVVAKPGGTATVGAGATTTADYPNPFYSLWSNTHNQYLVTAAELRAGGLFAGNITSLAIQITVTNLTMNDLSIKMAHTAATNMSAFLAPVFTNVFSATTYTPVVGVNTMTFTAPFNWDGVSNIVIEICHGNSGSSATMSSTAMADNTPYVSTIHTHKSAASAASATCIDLTTNLNTYSIRPKFIFGGIANSPLSSYSWSDGSGTIGTTNPITVSPVAATNYTFTATDANGCSISLGTPHQQSVISNTLSGVINVGTGQTYTTLTSAINAYNNACTLSGPVTFLLTDASYSTAETFPLVINNHPQASATNTLTIRPAAGISVSITGSSSASVINLNAAKYVTIDGSNNSTNTRDLTVSNTSAATSSAVIWAQNSVAGDSTIRNTISNVVVNGNSNTTTLFGIGIGGTTIGTASLGNKNNKNVIKNCKVSKVQYGIYSAGASVAVKNQDNIIDSNELNAASPNNIQYRGILVGFENNMRVTNNKVGNISSGSTVMGISLGVTSTNTYTPTGNEVTNAIVSKNVVGPVIATAGTTAFGIAVPAVTSGTNTFTNNSVFSIRSGATPSDFCAGIYIGGGAGSSTKLYFNSVSLTDAAARTTPSAYAIVIGGTDPVVEMKNNIFYNTQTASGAGNSYAIGYASAAFTNLVSDYNLYYTAGANAQFAVTGGIGINTVGTIQATLAALKTATGKDANSISVNPFFASTTNLTPGLGVSLLGGGVAIAGITTDIVDSLRANPPSIGAYEKGADLTGPSITYATLSNDLNPAGTRVVTAFATITDFSGVNVNNGSRPRIYYKKKSNANAFLGNTSVDNGWKWVEASNATSPFDFVIDYSLILGGFVTNLDTIQYFVVAQDNVASPNIGANPSAGFSGTNVNSITAAPTTVNQYIIVNLPPLSGSYDIGAGLTSPNFPTITAALSDLSLRGVSAAVVFNLVDATYGSAETFPISLPQFAGASATNTVTIKPAANVVTTISGSATTAILKFANKAQYYIVDGSNNGTSTRNLTIYNTSTATSSVVWFEGLNAAEGVKHAVLKNTLVKGGSNGAALGVLVGGATIGLSSNGMGTDSLGITNNNIYNCYYPLVISGASASNKVQNIDISKNDIGADTASLSNQYYGVYTINANRLNVHHNHIYNLRTTGSLNISAVQITDNTTNSSFSNNRIHGISSTSTSGYGAYGITVASNTGVDNDSICNNTIYDLITSNYSVTGTAANAFGIRLTGGSNLKIYYNSVNLYGQPVTGTSASASAALMILSNTYAGVDIRNNSFTNSMTGVTGSKHYAFWTTLTAPIASSVFNYNNFFASGTFGVLMNGNGTAIPTLAGLKAATGANANSIAVFPYFTANDTLIAGAGVLKAQGIAISTVQTDIIDIVRANPPAIGAYENDNGKDLAPPQISYTPLANSSSTTAYALNNFATITDNFAGVNITSGTEPRLYYKKKYDGNQFLPGNTAVDSGWKWVAASNSTSPFSFTIDYSKVLGGTVSNFDSIYYFVVAQDNALTANTGAYPSAGFAGSNVATITSAPTSPDFYVIVTAPPMAGTYTIGTSGTYASISSAINDLNFRGVSAAVTFELLNASYSEAFPVTINAYSGASAVNTVKIKPAAGVSALITGASATSIFKLNGADYVTIDGSNNGTASRDLTIENTSTGAGTAGIWLASTGLNAGAKLNTIKNCVIRNGAVAVDNYGIIAAGVAISTTSVGENNDSLVIDNNSIQSARFGIYLSSPASGMSTFIKVRNNLMNATATNAVGRMGVTVTGITKTEISGNKMANFSDTTTSSVLRGIQIKNNSNNIVVFNNEISELIYSGTAGYSGQGITVESDATTPNVSAIDVYNNFISGLRGDGDDYATFGAAFMPVGVYVRYVVSGVRVFNNSINLYGSSVNNDAGCFSAGIALDDNAQATLYNNIINNKLGLLASTGIGAIGIFLEQNATQLVQSNYNNIFVSSTGSGLNITGRIAGTNYTSLSDWKTITTKEANSKNVAVNFTSNTNLHLTGASNGDVNLIATPIAGLTTDIDGNTRSAQYPYMGADEASNPLPVKLTTFTAVSKGADVLVSWATASEINNKGFDVERSVDGNTFIKVGFVKGAGNSSRLTSYNLNDGNAFKAAGSNTLYYRLRQIDFDGKQAISDVVIVTGNEMAGASEPVVYPNPFDSKLQVQLFAVSNSTVQINIFDLSGREIVSKQAALSEGLNAVEIDKLANLDRGVYFVSITQNGNTTVKKVIKN